MSKIFITDVEHDHEEDHTDVILTNEHDNEVAVRMSYDENLRVTITVLRSEKFAAFPTPYVNDAVFAAAVIMKLNELTTPETAIPLVVDITEPLLLVEF
ncbi:hypothetical protein [Ancylobacter rudongensis]|uniref:Uncharacterized protein n=1 Tax=Ancylobacter rudongensis TaxID=177413 RepID=A0A1G4UPD0_9HYPH|nr:hypothetical protein [Ancylobacter rudongensis]SCW95511.1 hypothetical protein SAMN05660859_0044 [Ancylobacter rudongensis]